MSSLDSLVIILFVAIIGLIVWMNTYVESTPWRGEEASQKVQMFEKMSEKIPEKVPESMAEKMPDYIEHGDYVCWRKNSQVNEAVGKLKFSKQVMIREDEPQQNTSTSNDVTQYYQIQNGKPNYSMNSANSIDPTKYYQIQYQKNPINLNDATFIPYNDYGIEYVNF